MMRPLLLLLLVVTLYGGGCHATCRYWCKTPENQTYCCEDEREIPSKVGLKPGKCPPVRPVCPPTRGFFEPPKTCSNDGSCYGADKCCFDRCLGEHVCKPIQTRG
uniref:Crustin n=2 Tax=Eriocheir TaxID=95601 RepID=C5MTC7_ERISI|nr:crustin-1 [Eriocheir sinensis]ACR77767.1 crustin I [Eriocheir sinensis]ADB10836.1 crustin [Eriocheir sinensis]UCU83344.1 crustin [Eriocheir hepuensis]